MGYLNTRLDFNIAYRFPESTGMLFGSCSRMAPVKYLDIIKSGNELFMNDTILIYPS